MDIVDNFDVEGFDETDSPMRPKVASEAKANAVEFIKRYLELERQKKEIADAVKDLKHEFEEQGTPTKVALKALANIRKKKKMSESQICELEAFEDWINESKDINDKITLLS